MDDRTLLLHAEQGFGDTIQFIRYLPLVARRVGRTVIECQPELQRLLGTMAGDCQIVVRGKSLPEFDLHCPLGSLPRVFRTTEQTIPAHVPYLFPDPSLLESWCQKLVGPATGPKVAFAWAGNPSFKNDRTRSLTLDRLAPLGQVPGVTLFSVQKGDAGRQADNPPAGLPLLNLCPTSRILPTPPRSCRWPTW